MSSKVPGIAAHPQESGSQKVALALWLLPIVFSIHDGEELFAIPGWMAGHQQELNRLAAMSAVAAKLIRSLPTTPKQVAVAIGFILLVFIVVTLGASMSTRRGFWVYAYASLLGGLTLHVFTHIAQAVLVGGYVPGLVGALAAVVPGALYIYKRLFEAKFLNLKSAAFTALIGLALFVPGALFAHQIGRVLGAGWSPPAAARAGMAGCVGMLGRLHRNGI